MELVQVDGKEIRGVSVRTTNADEMNPGAARIPGLWQRFLATIAPDMAVGASLYGVYHDYESDASGAYSLLAGTDGVAGPSTNAMETVRIESGKYLVFAAQGDMPQVVIDTWARIWDYFSSDQAEHARAYTTDFELYKGDKEVEIHIAVH